MTAATTFLKHALAASFAVLAFPSVHGAEIYRWVDDEGRTQLSDHVPEKYRARATPLGDSRQYELTPQQRTEADARAARDKRQRELDDQRRAADEEAEAQAARAAASAASAAASRTAKPAAARTGATDCAGWKAEYEKSGECYARFHLVNGRMKAGALEECGPPVPDLSESCALGTK